MKQAITIFLIFISYSYGQSQAQTDLYSETLSELMKVTGSEATYKTVVTQMIEMFKQQNNSSIPDKFWDELETELNADIINDLLKILTPIYQKHLSIKDLREVIAFYNSPTGKKFAQKTPIITQESMDAGQIWGAEIGAKIAMKLKDEGY